MDDAVPVRVIQCFAALEDDLDDGVDRQQVGGQGTRLKRTAGDVFHDDIAAFFVGNGVVDRDEMRMGKLPGKGCLDQEQLVKASAVLFVTERISPHQFDGYLATRKGVIRQINGTGRAPAELLYDLVFADLVHVRSVGGRRSPAVELPYDRKFATARRGFLLNSTASTSLAGGGRILPACWRTSFRDGCQGLRRLSVSAAINSLRRASTLDFW